VARRRGARRSARTRSDGALLPLAEQDRDSWEGTLISEGVKLISATLARAPVGPYRLQTAIAAVHAEAKRPEDTDWPQVAALYRVLDVVPRARSSRSTAPSPWRWWTGRRPAWTWSRRSTPTTGSRGATACRPSVHTFWTWQGPRRGTGCYREAARRTTSVPEQRYLEDRAARLSE
jgi:hypothetical protein